MRFGTIHSIELPNELLRYTHESWRSLWFMSLFFNSIFIFDWFWINQRVLGVWFQVPLTVSSFWFQQITKCTVNRISTQTVHRNLKCHFNIPLIFTSLYTKRCSWKQLNVIDVWFWLISVHHTYETSHLSLFCSNNTNAAFTSVLNMWSWLFSHLKKSAYCGHTGINIALFTRYTMESMQSSIPNHKCLLKQSNWRYPESNPIPQTENSNIKRTALSFLY